VRVLLVSQFWPGPADPDLGVFVRQVAVELERRGHVVARAVVDRRGAGRAGDARMTARAVRLATGLRPDVVFAHFLAPAGVAGALASVAARAPLVVMAHGQDVRNLRLAPVRAATAAVVRRADAVIANSAFLAAQLAGHLPAAAAKTHVVDCGVDLDAFAPRDQAAARARLGLAGATLEPPVVTFVGGLTERKNVVRLRAALDGTAGTLVAVGDGPLRGALAGHPRIRLAGAVPHAQVPDWIAAGDLLVLPSLEEPLGQVVLEALAGARSVVATRVGGPAELVPPGAGALVDPLDVASIRAGLEAAAALPVPNPAARAAAEPHGLGRQADRMEALLAAAAGGPETGS
jgi:glycosyltransferase involved in cell wall biosynthesis